MKTITPAYCGLNRVPRALKPGIVIVSLLTQLAPAAWADIVQPTVTAGSILSNLLVTAFGTASPPAVTQNSFSYYQVAGSGPVDVGFKLVANNGDFRFTAGIYRYSPGLGRLDLATPSGKVAYASMALDPTNCFLVFDERAVPPPVNGAARTITLNGGDVVGMFLIPHATLAEFQTNQANFALTATTSGLNPPGPKRWPLFTLADANPGGDDQALSFAGISTNSLPACLVTFEDLTRTWGTYGSDENFTDVSIAIENVTPVLVPNVNAFAVELFDPPGSSSSAPYRSGVGFAKYPPSNAGVFSNSSLPHVSSDGSVLRVSGSRYLAASNYAILQRTLATNAVPAALLDAGRFGADGSDVYVAFLARLESGSAGSDWAGLALMNGTSQQLLIGVPTNATHWGAVRSNAQVSAFPVDGATRLLVARIRFQSGDETVRLYVDPPFSGEPDQPAIPEFTVEDFRFDGIRLAASGAVYAFDEIRFGQTYASVLGDISLGVHPLATWDNYVHLGSNLDLMISAQGRGPFQYQWFRGQDLLPDATNATFSILNAQWADAGGYSIRISNSVEGIVVSNISVTVLAPELPLPITWRNAAGGGWRETNNWSLNRLPTASDTVRITAPGTYNVDVASNFVATAGDLLIGGPGASPRLRIRDARLTVSGSVTNLATLELANQSPNPVASSLFVTNGLLVNSSGGSIQVLMGDVAGPTPTIWANLDNAGRFDVYQAPTFSKPAVPVRNRGLLNIVGAAFTLSGSGASFLNVGTCQLASVTSPTAPLRSASLGCTGGGGMTNGAAGIIRGVGNFILSGGSTFRNDGLLAPGLPLGKLTIQGPWTQSASGAMDFELGGLGAGTTYDQVTSQNTPGPALRGALNITLANGFDPRIGDKFSILMFPSPTSTFDAINLPQTNRYGWDVVYSSTEVSLTVLSDGPTLRLLSLDRSTDVSLLTWVSVPGRSYRVQFKNRVDDPAWNNLAGDVLATGETASKLDETSANVPHRVYRVRRVP